MIMQCVTRNPRIRRDLRPSGEALDAAPSLRAGRCGPSGSPMTGPIWATVLRGGRLVVFLRKGNDGPQNGGSGVAVP